MELRKSKPMRVKIFSGLDLVFTKDFPHNKTYEGAAMSLEFDNNIKTKNPKITKSKFETEEIEFCEYEGYDEENNKYKVIMTK